MRKILKEEYISYYSLPKEETELFVVENQADEDSPSLNDIDFTENDQTTAIKELQTKSSAGPNGVPVVIFKKVGENHCEPLNIMWRVSLRTGVIHTPLKVGSICQIT